MITRLVSRIVALVALLVEWVAQEYAASRTRRKFVWSSGCDVGVAKAAKHTEVSIIRRCAEEELEGGAVLARSTRASIEKICGRGKCIWPKRWRKGGLEHESAKPVVERAQDAFGTPILLGSIGASQAQVNAMLSKERTRCRVIKLLPVVSLEALNGALELGANESMKEDQSRQNI